MQNPSFFRNFFLLLSLFGFSLSMSSSASADDFRLIIAEPMYAKVENGKGTLASSCKSLDVDAGSAVFEDPVEGERAQYNWQVPTSIPDSGAAYMIAMEVKASQNYTATGSISINSPSQVKMEGALDLRKKADYGQQVRDTASGRIIPALEISEMFIEVRLDTLVGEFAGARYHYRRGPVPVPGTVPVPPPSTEPKISAELAVNPYKVKPGETLNGTLRVTLEGLPNDQGEIELRPYVTTYMAADAVEDFTSNLIQFLFRLDSGSGSFLYNERVKIRPPESNYVAKARNGVNEYKIEELMPVKIPAELDEGEYLLLVIVTLKGTKIRTFPRTGVDVEKDPKRLALRDSGAQVTPKEGYENSTFVLKLSYVAAGMKDGDQEEVKRMNLRVFGRIEGGETPIPVPEQPLKLTPVWKGQSPERHALGEATITAPSIKEPGTYTWNFTLAASDGFPPHSGKVSFTVKPGTLLSPNIPEGHAMVSGLGTKGRIEIRTADGDWTPLADGMTFSLKGSHRTEVRTGEDGATVEFPGGKKVVMDRNSEMGFDAIFGRASIRSGRFKVYQPGKPVKSFPNIWKYETPAADFEELGTIFSIAHDPATNVTVIEVEEGEVLVTPKNTNFPPVTLRAGDRLEVSPDKVGSITTGSGKSEGGGEFGERILKVFRSNNISDDTAFDAFAALSLQVASRNLPASCYDNDPNISHSTWNGHRQWSRENGREKSGKNALWKTGKALACLSNQIDKDRLIAEISQVLAQAEGGSVARITDLSSPTAQGGSTPPGSDSGSWTAWFDYDDPEGNADWEVFDMHKANVPCPLPVAVECRTKDGRDWKAAGQKMKCSMEEPNPGGICNNVDNAPSSCLDYEVRFSCGGQATIPPGTNTGGTGNQSSPGAAVNPGLLDPAAANQNPGALEPGINRYGSDYRDLNLSTDDAQLCISECKKETRCKAWTFVKAGAQGAQAKCWFKHSVPPATADPNAISGVIKQVSIDPATANQKPAEYEPGINRYGSDIRSIDVASEDVQVCNDECMKEPQCQSWTFVKAGAQGHQAKCWIKNAVPPATADPNTVSGVIVRPPLDPTVANQNPGEFEFGINRYGSDYRDLSTTDAELCSAECKKETQCRSWTFVKAGAQGPQPKCWLKNAVPPATADPNTVSGVIPNRAAADPVTPPAVVPGNTKDGNWTPWLDYDDPEGNADWEAFDMHKANVPCPSPSAVECRTKDGRDWKAAGQKMKCSMEEPNPGGICNNVDNAPSSCLDYEVRFSCGGAVPAGAQPGGPPSPPVPSAGQLPAGGTVPAASGQPQDMGAQILAGKVFQVFRSPSIPDSVTMDAFAAISLHIAQYRLPNSCFAEDPYVNVGTWDGHRAWSQQQGREVSARNIVWKTTSARACLNEQQKADLFNQVWWILEQAEKGAVTRLPDLPPPGNTWAPAAGTGAGPTLVWPPPQPANPTPPAVTGTYQPPYPQQPQQIPTSYPPTIVTPPPQQPVYPPPPAINQGTVNPGVPATAGGNEYFENNMNRFGGDYHNFELTGTDPGPCASACYQDSRCHAWTYVRAGHQGANPKCWLKNQIPNPTANECCISGIVPLEVQAIIDRRPPAEGAEPSPETGWTGWLNRDSPNASADWESLAELRSSVPCEKPVAIQCRVLGTGQDWSSTGQKYKCSLDEPDSGGICINAENPPNGCLDYEVRFRCYIE